MSNGVDDEHARVAAKAMDGLRGRSANDGRGRSRRRGGAHRRSEGGRTPAARGDLRGLIGVAVVMVQRLAAMTLDTSARSASSRSRWPSRSALVLVNRQETFRSRRSPSVSVTVAQSVAQLAGLIGIAGFWHHVGRRGCVPRRRDRGDRSTGRLLACGDHPGHRVLARQRCAVRATSSQVPDTAPLRPLRQQPTWRF